MKLPVVLLGILIFPLAAISQSVTYDGYGLPGYGRDIVLIAGDEEYRSEEALPQLGKILAQHHGFRCSVLFPQALTNPGIIDPNYLENIPGLEALKTARLLIIATRFRNLPDEQMAMLEDYLLSGRPVIGMRTANHGFRIPKERNYAHWDWRYEGEKEGWRHGFGQVVLGDVFFSHHGWHGKESTRGLIAPDAKGHPIARGLKDGDIWGPSDVYGAHIPLTGDGQTIVLGQVLAGMEPDSPVLGKGPYEKAPDYVKEGSNDKNSPLQPVAWTRTYQLPEPGAKPGRCFNTTMGAASDLASAGTRRMLVNAAYWCLDIDVPKNGANVDLVGAFTPSNFGTKKGDFWQKKGLQVTDFEYTVTFPEVTPNAAPYADYRSGREGYEFADHPVNRYRLYDFYKRRADYFLNHPAEADELLPAYPDLDAGANGHWGFFHKNGYRDRRWNLMEHDVAFSNILRVEGVKDSPALTRAIAVNLGDGYAAAFDTETLSWRYAWQGGFVKFQPGRWGIGGGMIADGKVIWTGKEKHEGRYLGHLRNGDRITLKYEIDGKTIFDTPTGIIDGELKRDLSKPRIAPVKKWNQSVTVKGKLGKVDGQFAIDRIPIPLENPYGTTMLLGGLGFFKNGDLAIGTMTGDIWIVSGLDDDLEEVTWSRFATGLNQPLGVEVFEGKIYVVGRDRITRLHDENGDGEADFYENFSDAYPTSSGGHDFFTGLQRDGNGYWYFTAANLGVQRISPDGSTADTMATGLRNTNGIGASRDGIIVSSTNEGDWQPASAVFEIREGDFYGRGAKPGQTIAPPLAFVPRGIDNSTGGQTFIDSPSWKSLNGQLLTFSFGAGTWYLVLRDTEAGDRAQGAVVPLPGDFESGAHRGRFSPKDGHLYVVGADGWGNYAITDGDFARIRRTDAPLTVPIGWEAHADGIRVNFDVAIDPKSVSAGRSFAAQWNYEYSQGYGSPEYSLKTPIQIGHDKVPIDSVVVEKGGKSVFFKIPDLQPSMQMQLHARLRTTEGEAVTLDMYPTLLHLRNGADLKLRIRHPVNTKVAKGGTPGKPGRRIAVNSVAGLKFDVTEIKAKPKERITIQFKNIDTMQHNLVVLKPGSVEKVGALANEMLTDPKAAERHYIPESDDILYATPVLDRNKRYELSFNAPEDSGIYPYICTFPGHWMLMKGNLIIE